MCSSTGESWKEATLVQRLKEQLRDFYRAIGSCRAAHEGIRALVPNASNHSPLEERGEARHNVLWGDMSQLIRLVLRY